MSVSGLSTRPRLASVDEPAGVLGWTLTAPQPLRASAANAIAVNALLEGMRQTKVEDDCDRAPVRRSQRTPPQAWGGGGRAARRRGHAPSRRACPGGGDARRARPLAGAAVGRHLE